MSTATRTGELIGHAAEAALSGTHVLPADLPLRRQVADLHALAAELYPGVGSPQQLLFAVDQLHARAAQLAAIATLPGCPDRAAQAEMTTPQVEQAATRVAAAVYGLGVHGGRRGTDPRQLAAAFDMSVAAAVAIVDAAARGAR